MGKVNNLFMDAQEAEYDDEKMLDEVFHKVIGWTPLKGEELKRSLLREELDKGNG